jgi:hypothetical protein
MVTKSKGGRCKYCLHFQIQIKIPSTNYPENYKTWVLSDLCERSQHCRFVVIICKMCLSSLSSIVKITIYLIVINNLPYKITALNLNSLSQVKLHRLKSITYLLTIWSVQKSAKDSFEPCTNKIKLCERYVCSADNIYWQFRQQMVKVRFVLLFLLPSWKTLKKGWRSITRLIFL